MTPPHSPPDTRQQLLERAYALAGFTLGELAEMAGLTPPPNLRRHKGWPGQLIELWLGAEAGSKQTQDFAHLGVELKTLPLDSLGRPLETTYVCYAHLTGIAGLSWENSNVRNKLSQVLWVPIQGERRLSPADRIVGTPILWHPTGEQEAALKQDWEEIMEFIALGNIEKLTARHGEVLQLRPKAADGSALTDALGPEGTRIKTRPRGFYLKKQFTSQILEQLFNMR